MGSNWSFNNAPIPNKCTNPNSSLFSANISTAGVCLCEYGNISSALGINVPIASGFHANSFPITHCPVGSTYEQYRYNRPHVGAPRNGRSQSDGSVHRPYRSDETICDLRICVIFEENGQSANPIFVLIRRNRLG